MSVIWFFGFLLENIRLCHGKRKIRKGERFVISFRLYFIIAADNSKKEQFSSYLWMRKETMDIHIEDIML
jgi:hypothetical protein